MAKTKAPPSNAFTDLLIESLNKKSLGTNAYLQGDLGKHTYGVPIPYLAAIYLLGGMNVLPISRYFGVSGEEKSFKSTLQVEFGNWFLMAGGMHLLLDPEQKTSATMLDAMTWWDDRIPPDRRIYKACRSIDEWQVQVTTAIKIMRAQGPVPKGQRVPVYIVVDGMTSKGTESQMANLEKEGEAAERGYPVAAAKTTYFLESLNLLGTTCAVGWVQHMKAEIEQDSYGGTKYKEKGAKASQFACSTHLRVTKWSGGLNFAEFPGAPSPSTPVTGYELYVKCVRSSVGESDHSLILPVLWQHIPQESGETRQAMWFDWYGALGALLLSMKYNDKHKPRALYAQEKAALAEVVDFSQPHVGKVTCKKYGLEDALATEFGRAIENDPETRAKLAKFFHVATYANVQDVDIDWAAGDLIEKKKK